MPAAISPGFPAGRAGKGIQVDVQLDRIEGDVQDVQPAQTRGAVEPVARMPPVRLRNGHDGVSRPGQGVIDGQVAEHAPHEAVVGIAAAEGTLEQLGAQGFDFIDVLGAGKPPVHAADVALGRPCADFGGKQPADGGLVGAPERAG
jgi:hypothetical protein